MLTHRMASTVLSGLLLLTAVPAVAQAGNANFSGTWKKDNAHSTPVRPGEVTMKIEQHNPSLQVEMTVSRPQQPERHAVQDYTTDGKESVSVGADGDRFVTRVMWQDGALLFNVEEHEDGRVLHSTETWKLSADGTTLTRLRHTEKEDQRTVYLRQR